MYGQPPGYGAPGYGQPPPPGYGGGYGGGYGAPGYGMPQQQGGPTIIHINNDDDDGTPCQYCGTNTNHITRRKIGCVAISWALCLLFTTGILCFIPCCTDGCKDVQLICVKCQNLKNTIPANCC